MQGTSTSESQQTPITRKRRSQLVILSSPPSTEIRETQQQTSTTTDSIQVNAPQANHINREEYHTVPKSSASLELPGSGHISNASTKDQEADSALGLSSPIGDDSAPASASFIDQEDGEAKETAGRRFNFANSRLPASSNQIVVPRSGKEDQRVARRQATSNLAQTSDIIEGTPNSVQPSEGAPLRTSPADTAASSPLFYPDPREELRESSSDAAHPLIPSQHLVQSQLVDTSAQQPTSQTRNDLVPASASSEQGQNIQTHRPRLPVFATPSPVLRGASGRRGASKNLSTRSQELRTSVRSSPQSPREPTDFLRQRRPSAPVRQLPRAKLFQRLNLSGQRQPAGSIAAMSASSRETSPRVRRSAPPTERGTSSSSLRETLIKQTAPARALQQARHERTANRLISRAASTATDSTRASLTASPTRAVASASSNMSPNRAPGANGVFSNSMQVDESEPPLVSSIAPAISVYNSALGSSALPLHPSIEDDQALPQVSRPSLPSSPILGPGEYVVPLPAEGKIKDHYLECIRSKRRSLIKFIRNPKSTGRANMSRDNVCF